MAIYFIAAVQDQYLKDIHSLAKEMEEKGCTISRVTQVLGIITGSIQEGQSLEELKVKGIDQIEIDRQIKPM